MSKKGTKQESDILDQFKKADREIKMRLLIGCMGRLRELARDVLEKKEEALAMLESVGVDEKDIKRVIDFVNEGVKLSESDKKEIREKVMESKEEKEKEIAEDVQSQPLHLQLGGSQYSTVSNHLLDSGSASAVYTVSGADSSTNEYKVVDTSGTSLDLELR